MELLKSELGDLMPVTFLTAKPEGTTQPAPSPLILTPEGRGLPPYHAGGYGG